MNKQIYKQKRLGRHLSNINPTKPQNLNIENIFQVTVPVLERRLIFLLLLLVLVALVRLPLLDEQELLPVLVGLDDIPRKESKKYVCNGLLSSVINGFAKEEA